MGNIGIQGMGFYVMAYYVEALSRLVEQFMKIPSVGRKTAQRMAFHVLNLSKEDAENFANAIMDAHDKIHKCSVCFNLTEGELCPVCSNPKREKGLICVVEGPRDVIAIERTREIRCISNILHGVFLL